MTLIFNHLVYKSYKNTPRNICRWARNINRVSLSSGESEKKYTRTIRFNKFETFQRNFCFFFIDGMKPARSYRSTASIQQP